MLDLLGAGFKRRVYSLGPRHVLKVAICPIGDSEHGREQNLREWANWKTWGGWLDKWLVPCVACDTEGEWLIMERGLVARPKDARDRWGFSDERIKGELPHPLNQINDSGILSNWVRHGGKLKMCDYGRVLMTKRRKDVKSKK